MKVQYIIRHKLFYLGVVILWGILWFFHNKFIMTTCSFVVANLGLTVFLTLSMYLLCKVRFSVDDYIKIGVFTFSFIPVLIVSGFLTFNNGANRTVLNAKINGYSTSRADHYFVKVLGKNKYIYDNSISVKVNSEGEEFYIKYTVDLTLIPTWFDSYFIKDIRITKNGKQ